MNVLLVSQAYPPYPIVGAQRAIRIVQTLTSRGHNVFVVTQRLAGEGSELRVDEPNLKVHTVPLKPQYRLRFIAAKNWLLPRRSSQAAPEPGASRPSLGRASQARPGLVKRAILSLLWLPDDELRFVAPALRVARQLMGKYDIDIVYTTSPPHSSHLVGLRLRTGGDVKWVAEFRDPWTLHRTPELVAHWFGPVEAVHRWLEMRCLRAADGVVAVTNSVGDLLAAKLPEAERHKVSVVLNGIGKVQPLVDQPTDNAQFRIVHAGTFYLDRDPRPFLRALAGLRRRHGLGPSQLRVEFIGRCRTFEDVSIVDDVAANGLSDIVHFHEWMEPSEAQAMMRNAHLLLLLACSQPLQVPNKLFDYLGSRVPVLGIVDAGGESERMLQAVGGQHVVSIAKGEKVTEDAIRPVLEAAFCGRADYHAETNEDLLREWSSSVQMERLATAIGA